MAMHKNHVQHAERKCCLPLQVVVYVDGTRVGDALASEETPHHIIHRLCELDLAVSDLQQPPQQKGVGFRLKLPNLMQGKHEVRLSLCTQ